MTGSGLRVPDLRFLLPRLPASVTLLGTAAQYRGRWASAGVRLVDPFGADTTDLVVAPASRLAEALDRRPRMLLLHGRAAARRLGSAGYRSSQVLALPSPVAPRLLVPLEARAAVTAALSLVGPRRAGPTAALRAVALALLQRGVAPARAVVTVAADQHPAPWLLHSVCRAAAEDTPWFLWLGDGDALQRAVLHVLTPGGGQVVKFSRVAGNCAPFVSDERALRAAAELPATLARHVPRFLVRGDDCGRPYIVESRFAGRALSEVLLSQWPIRRRLGYVERISAWLHGLAEASVSPPGSLASERDRLVREVLPAWVPSGVSAELVAVTETVPGVLQHNDVGTWNVVADQHGNFGVVDWESARRPGMPLWDLTYFLADALTLLGQHRVADRTEHMLSLFRGESPHSGLLFANVRRAVDRLRIAPDAVGPLVTLGWLHHGLSLARREEQLHVMAGGGPAGAGPISRLAPRWLADPGLGVDWRAWR